jgi:hypothetical protein
MAHCHDIAAYSIQEEKRGKVYQVRSLPGHIIFPFFSLYLAGSSTER